MWAGKSVSVKLKFNIVILSTSTSLQPFTVSTTDVTKPACSINDVIQENKYVRQENKYVIQENKFGNPTLPPQLSVNSCHC